MADDGVFRSGIMLRIGKTEEIVRQYEEGYLRFSCPGNWIMYAKKNHDDGIADRYEAVFAHVKRDDPRLLEAFNNDPTEMAWSLWARLVRMILSMQGMFILVWCPRSASIRLM